MFQQDGGILFLLTLPPHALTPHPNQNAGDGGETPDEEPASGGDVNQGTAEVVPAEPVGSVQHEAEGDSRRERGKVKSKVRRVFL